MYSPKAVQSFIIVFGFCEIMTKGDIQTGIKHEARYALSVEVLLNIFTL
jgi:hypothetical protein